MIARSKRSKFLMVSILVSLALTLLLTSVVSAGIIRVVEQPWRGSGLAKIYVYGRAYNSADDFYYWMEVHSQIWKESSSGVWYMQNEEVVGGEDTTYVSCTARCTPGISSSWFKTKSFHEWDYDGSSYCAEWKESAPVYC